MADIIDSAEQEDESGVDDSTLTDRLNKEIETNTQSTQQAEQDLVSTTQPEDEVPTKFRGKTVDEIVDSYTNLEQQYGRQGNELGELRKLADSLIQKNLSETSSQRAESLEKEVLSEEDFFTDPVTAVRRVVEEALEKEVLSEEDFFTDPVTAVRRVVEEALEPVKQNLGQTQLDSTVQKLQAKHPDLEAIVNDSSFQNWVLASTPRQEMWTRASNGDFDYADELFSQYKAVNQVSVQAKREQDEAVKEEELKAATTVSAGSSRDAGSMGKPIYKRSELIRLRMNDPQRYQDLHTEIMQAYADNRVR